MAITKYLKLSTLLFKMVGNTTQVEHICLVYGRPLIISPALKKKKKEEKKREFICTHVLEV